MYVVRDGKLAHDERTERALAPLGKIGRLHEGRNADVWAELEDGRLVRVDGEGTARDLTPPERLKQGSDASVSGTDKGAVWAVGGSGALYRLDGEAWTQVPLPRSPFAAAPYSAHAVRVRQTARRPSRSSGGRRVAPATRTVTFVVATGAIAR